MIQDTFVLSKQQAYTADKLTINTGVLEIELMQNAARSCVTVIEDNYPQAQKFLVLCGSGKNGGDGYLVAKHLKEHGKEVEVIEVLSNQDKASSAYNAKQSWLKNNPILASLDEVSIDDIDVIVDAIFGIGLSRDVTDEVADLITEINSLNKNVVSIDVPSGIEVDSGKILGAAIVADITVTFFRQKYCHLLEPGKSLSGKVLVKDIGITSKVLNVLKPHVYENTPDLWVEELPYPLAMDHKYSRGHSLVFGGEMGKVGAAKLAAISALRSGAGLVSVICNEDNSIVYNNWAQAVMCYEVNDLSDYLDLLQDKRIKGILIGPGIGDNEEMKSFIEATLRSKKPCVLDADVFTIYQGARDELCKLLHPDVVLTPHMGEFSRVFDYNSAELSKIDIVCDAAEKSNAVILLKGSDTVVASLEGKVVINSNASPRLATAGSGDVLSGIIVGLMTAGMSAFDAACAGAYIHGEIGSKVGFGAISEDFLYLIGDAIDDLIAV